jgi:hypothetical protein
VAARVAADESGAMERTERLAAEAQLSPIRQWLTRVAR